MSGQMRAPPRGDGAGGEPRRIGVEIEFAAISAADTAEHVRALYGGAVEMVNPHRYAITASALGDFTVELDFQYIHRTPAQDAASGNATSGKDASLSGEALLREFRRSLSAVLGDISALVVPCEIACPPLPLARLDALEPLMRALRDAGAQGTETSLFYAFGLHLNPEAAALDSHYIAAVMKAYLLLSGWLRAEINVDMTRRVLAYTNPFPEAYVSLATDSGYWPEEDRLIDDYLAHNPTRNRELDMLPLFAWLDEGKIATALGDTLVNRRPTFHYRLPNSNLTMAGWSLMAEWNRWCVVEHLAEDHDRLAEMAKAYTAWRGTHGAKSWGAEAQGFVSDLLEDL